MPMNHERAGNSSIFNGDRHHDNIINPLRTSREEWWLNVNYVEVVDLRGAVSVAGKRKIPGQ